MEKTQDELIREEQNILDNLIREMDETLIKLDSKLTYDKLQAKKAKEVCLPDAYGMLVSAEHEKIVVRQQMRELWNGRDELYDTRLILDYSNNTERGREELKVGLHTYMNNGNIFIMSWKMPLCRNYVLDNAAEEYDGIVTGKYGEKYKTHYSLKLKRKIDIFFDKVKKVVHYFPIADEKTEQIIADEFLQELLNRRSGQEFKNVVFSIQRKQGEIIQTPFKQNLIVQGCAGSGKSMIMLHRLPIVIYDNPERLDRNNLYIITPSIAYIQMANNMRLDLEIEDLNMGTLNQYYDYVLTRYRVKSETYGTIKPYIHLDEAGLKYVYSIDCIKDISAEFENIINIGKVNCESGYQLFNLKNQNEKKEAFVPAEIIRNELLKIQSVITENDKSLRSYYRNITELFKQLEEFARMFETRKIAVNRGILSRISSERRLIAKKEKEINKITHREIHETKYKNLCDAIAAAENRIAGLNEAKAEAESNVEYFSILKEKAKEIRQILVDFTIKKNELIEMTIDEQYQMLYNAEILCDKCENILMDVKKIEDPYWKYINGIGLESKKVEAALENLENNHNVYLPKDYLKKLIEAKTYYNQAEKNAAHNVYLLIMKRLGQEPDEKGRLDALDCSPYLYLQIMYLFAGVPNGTKESLITIDEAQNVEPEELKLIKKVNGEKVVLNLFGDVKQHVEGTKGIDDWKQITGITNFQKKYMQENYRNARQITKYCNKHFGLSMQAINLDGAGVHELKNQEDFECALQEIFKKPKNIGLSSIIVKNEKEADFLVEEVGKLKSRIHNMTKNSVELQKSKWNLMTVEQAKGLEFEIVFAVIGRMTENEKYITCMRALDELYVYDKPLIIAEVKSKDIQDSHKDVIENVSIQNVRRKREKRKSKEKSIGGNKITLKEYFEEKGLQVIDNRKQAGHLWVIGSKTEIDSIINEAVEKYGVTGSYGSGKASGYKAGWFTKSKK